MLFSTQILGFTRRPARVVALALLAVLGLGACGQKGALYLPPPNDQSAPKSPTPR